MSDFTASGPSVAVSRTDLFVGFLKVGLSGFGGVLPFARRMLVEQRRWLTEREFIEVLSLSQFLPGPNIVNVSIIVGSRFAAAGRGRSRSSRADADAVPDRSRAAPRCMRNFAANRGGARRDQRRIASGDRAGDRGGHQDGAPARRRPGRSRWPRLTFVAIALLRIPLLWALAMLAPALDRDRVVDAAMNVPLLADLAQQFALLSFLAIGGVNALLPEIHRRVVEKAHWLT